MQLHGSCVRSPSGGLRAGGVGRRTRTNVALAFVFNGVGVPLAATGLVCSVWVMIGMVASVAAIFLISIGTRPALFFDVIRSVKACRAREDEGACR